MINAARKLSGALDPLTFAEPVTHVYNPHDYAWAPYEQYLQRFANSPKRVLFLGMNPGPYGMAQTGVPFGEVEAVRDWMGIDAPVGKPANEHPKRPIVGFACERSEVSGRRLWREGFAAWFESADAFFADHFVANYCPLVFMSKTGANVTPDKLRADERKAIEEHCDEHLRSIIEILEPEFLIGVGGFAKKRFETATKGTGYCGTIGQVLHPSPASPAANRGWKTAAEKQLKALGIL